MSVGRPSCGLQISLRVLSSCVVVTALVVPLWASSPEESAGREIGQAIAVALRGWLPGQLEEHEVPGAAVAMVDREQVLWEEVFGVTDGSGSPAITPETLFCVRSISKSVTALAVLTAVQDGLLDLDTPISEYLPDFTVHSRFEERPETRITLRHMLSHWAGFTHDPPAGMDVDSPGYFERYIDRISQTWLRFSVGYRLHYANYGVDLAGFILQERSGQPFAEYVRDSVFEPLGMVSSTFDLEVVARSGDRAVGHDNEGNAVQRIRLPAMAAGGLFSNLRDMSRYARFHLNGGMVGERRFLRQDLMREYHSIQFPLRDQRTGYALGLWREPVGDTISLYHAGGGRGFGAHLMLYPELGLGAVLLTNREYHGITEYPGRVVMNGPVLNRRGPTPIADPALDRMQRLDLDDPRVKGILGRYGDSPGVVIGFEDGVLGARFGDDSFAPLAMYDDGGQLVGMYYATRELRFLAPLGDQPGSMMMVGRAVSNSNSHYLEFNDSPNDPPGPDKPEWRQYLGEYEVLLDDDPHTSVAITTRNGYLYYRDGKCRERAPGLFFLYDGEVLDLRSKPSTFATQEIRRKD